MSPHAFRPHRPHPQYCAVCMADAGAPWHSLELFTDADREREEARRAQDASDLAATMRTVKADISQAAGRMERESPLFFGKGDTPTLWSS